MKPLAASPGLMMRGRAFQPQTITNNRRFTLPCLHQRWSTGYASLFVVKSSNKDENKPDKTAKQQDDSKSKSRQGKKGPSNNGSPRFSRPSEAQILAGHAVYIGCIGTVAAVAAQATHIDLYNMFQWNNTSQLALALALMLPLQVANVVILAPEWTDWKLPELSKQEEQSEIQAARAALSTKELKQQQAKSSGNTEQDEIQAALQALSADSLAEASTASSTATGNKAADASATSKTDQGNADQKAALPKPGMAGMIPADAWGQGNPNPTALNTSASKPAGNTPAQSKPSLGLPSMALLRNAAAIAQGNYVAANPAAGLSIPGEALVAALDSLSSEMLFRGILLTIITRWVGNVLLDSGLPDMVEVPPSLWEIITACTALRIAPDLPADLVANVTSRSAGFVVPVDDAAAWITLGAMLTLLSALSNRRVTRSIRKMNVMSQIRSRIAETKQAQKAQRDAKKRLEPPPAASIFKTKVSSEEDLEKTISSILSNNDTKPSSSSATNAATASAATNTSTSTTATTGSDSTESQTETPASFAAASQQQDSASTSTASTTTTTSGKQESLQGQQQDGSKPLGMSGSFLPKQIAKDQLDSISKNTSADTDKSSMAAGFKTATILAKQASGNKMIMAPGIDTGNTGFEPLIWSTALQSSRDLLQGSTLSLIFIATGGNLAACFAASFMNQVVFSLLQRLGLERTKKRSEALAEELKAFNAQLRAVAVKEQTAKLVRPPATALDSPPTTTSSNASSDTQKEAASPSPAAAATASKVEEAEKKVPDEPKPDTRMNRAISLLDMLIPENDEKKK